jgi:adenine-specific DNA methylase
MFVKVVMCWLLSHEPFVCLQNQEKKTKQAGSQARQERQEKAKNHFSKNLAASTFRLTQPLLRYQKIK